MPGRGAVEGAPFWSEAPFFITRLGCPAVYCAPGTSATAIPSRNASTSMNIYAGIVAFARFMTRYCGVVNE